MTDPASAKRTTMLFPLRWADMDANGHVNNAMYLRYTEEARVAFTREHPADEPLDLVYVVHADIDFRAPLVYRSEPVPIDVWISRIGGGSIEFSHQIYDETEAGRLVYADVKVVMATVDRDTGKAKRMSETTRTFFEQFLIEN